MNREEWIDSAIVRTDGSGESCGTSTIIGTGYGSGAHNSFTGHGTGHGPIIPHREGTALADGYGCGFAGGKWPDSRQSPSPRCPPGPDNSMYIDGT